MESTRLLDSLKKLRGNIAPAMTDIEIIRMLADQAAGKIGQAEMPIILTEPQRAYFLKEIDKLSSFLESEDGIDAVELLFNTFKDFVFRCNEIDEQERLEEERMRNQTQQQQPPSMATTNTPPNPATPLY